MPTGQKWPETHPKTLLAYAEHMPKGSRGCVSGPLLPSWHMPGIFSPDLQNLLSPKPDLNLGNLTSSTKNRHMPGICQKRGRTGSKVGEKGIYVAYLLAIGIYVAYLLAICVFVAYLRGSGIFVAYAKTQTTQTAKVATFGIFSA